jgi:hypothetical protein
MKTYLTPLLIILVLFTLNAQESISPIQPDRPGLGESSQVVPKKYLQIEMGGNLSIDAEGADRLYEVAWNNTTLRYGLFENFELRLAINLIQNYSILQGVKENSPLGFSPWSFGCKAKITEQKGAIPRTSLLGYIAIPYPSASFLKTSFIAPSILVPMEWDLTDQLLFTVNTGVFWNGEDAIPDYFASIGLDYALPKNWGVFIEAYMNMDENALFLPGANAGVIWRVLPNLQFDLSAGIGLNKLMADAFINGGISYRFPN